MSIFGAFKKGRKAAKDHIAKKAEKQQQEQKVPATKYRHVPTHAASDALMGSPFNCTKEDVTKIREHNKRRSELLFIVAQNQGGSASAGSSNSSGSGTGINSANGSVSASAIMLSSMRPGVSRHRSSRSLGTSGQWPRANSSLSKVTYPDGQSSPEVHTARSYNSLDAALQLGGTSTLSPDAALSKGVSSSSTTSCSASTPQASDPASSSASSLSGHPDELEEDLSASSTEKGKGKLQG